MPKNTAVVALDINTRNYEFLKYNALSAKQKIDLLVKKIREACSSLEKNEPDSNWIITWREYALTDPNSRFISNEDKKYFKEQMAFLSSEYPKLTIISGTAGTKKHFPNSAARKKLEEVKKYYATTTTLRDDTEGVSHYEQLKKLEQSSESDLDKGIDVVRNTSYIFANGKCVGRHDKTMPYIELTQERNWWTASEDKLQSQQLPQTIYQPGNKKNQSLIFLIGNDPDQIPVGIEICREHTFGTLLNENKNPLIQFVLAQGIAPELDHICGDFFILLDDKLKPQLLINKAISESEITQIPVRLYQMNMLNNESLKGPLQPIIIEQGKKILQRFDEIKDFIERNDIPPPQLKPFKLGMLELMKGQFLIDLSSGTPLITFKSQQAAISAYNSILAGKDTSSNINLKILDDMLTNLLNSIENIQLNLAPTRDVPVMALPTKNEAENVTTRMPTSIAKNSPLNSGTETTITSTSLPKKVELHSSTQKNFMPSSTTNTKPNATNTSSNMYSNVVMAAGNFAAVKMADNKQWIDSVVALLQNAQKTSKKTAVKLKEAQTALSLAIFNATESLKELYIKSNGKFDGQKVADIQTKFLNSVNSALSSLPKEHEEIHIHFLTKMSAMPKRRLNS